MCLNSSSLSGSSPGTAFHQLLLCFYTSESIHSGMFFLSVSALVILPICSSVLYLGLQQLRTRSKISHSDAFTYHVSFIQIIGVFATFVSTIGTHLCNVPFVLICIYIFFINSSALLIFQCLTCGERYMAVVHPMTYLRLKKRTMTRNIICGLVWVQCFLQGIFGGSLDIDPNNYISVYLGLAFVLLYIIFCNISVLVVLVRPRPGDGGKKNQTTQRAFNTIFTIFGTLVLKGAGDIIGTIATVLNDQTSYKCSMWLTVGWFSLPSTLILQIIFLYRRGKLPFCRKAQTQVVAS